jgi:hypothetical protein
MMQKMKFGQAYCKDQLNRILMKVISYFSKFYCIFYIFWKFNRISGNVNEIEKPKIGCIVLGCFWPTAEPDWARRPARAMARGQTAAC